MTLLRRGRNIPAIGGAMACLWLLLPVQGLAIQPATTTAEERAPGESVTADQDAGAAADTATAAPGDPGPEAAAEAVAPPTPAAFADHGDITAVTCYDGWASITRQTHFSGLPVDRDVTVRVIDLPTTADPGSLQAFSMPGIEIRGLSIESVEDVEAHEAALSVIDAERDILQQKQAEAARRLGVLAKQEAFYDALAQRTADSAAQSLGNNELNLDRLTEFASFLAEQHATLLEERTELEAEQQALRAEQQRITNAHEALIATGPERRRDVLITLRKDGSMTADPVAIELRYLVRSARWQPAYKIRVDRLVPSAFIEFDVQIEQNTGEDWDNVRLTVSTAPAVRPLDQLTLDLWPLEAGDDAFRSSTPLRSEPRSDGSLDVVALDRLVERGVPRDRTTDWPPKPDLRRPEGEVAPFEVLQQVFNLNNGGSLEAGLSSVPLTSFEIDEPVTVLSGPDQTQRVRIARVRTRSEFRLVGVPLIAPHPCILGEITNGSTYHLPPGPAQVFLGSEFTGMMSMPYLGPGETLEAFVGLDDRLSIERKVVDTSTRTTGLLGDGTETRIDHEIAIRNTSGETIQMQLWDRIPYSTDDRIKVSLTDVTARLSRDSTYRRYDRPQGLLRWDLEIPAADRPNSHWLVKFSAVISHKKDVVPTVPSPSAEPEN